MSFANPWGLLGLLSLPAIVALHMYQRRFPRMPAAGLHLWGAHVDAHDAGPRRERPPLTASLLLELLVAAALTLVISRPRFDSASKAAHLVVVLDSSAAMSAEPLGETPLRQRALELLQERIDALPPGSVVTVLLSGRRPTMLAGPALPAEEAADQLAGWNPREPTHDFGPAWDFASQLAADSGRLLFITARPPPENAPLPRGMEVVSVGQRCDNVAVTTANWTLRPVYARDRKRVERLAGKVFLRVHNFGPQPVQAVVSGTRGDGTELFREKVALPARTGRGIDKTVAGGTGRLQIDVQSDRDELALDSRVVLVEPRLRPVKVALDLPEDSAAYRAFADVFRLLPAVQMVGRDEAVLIVAPANPLPPSREGLWWLGVGPLDPSAAAKKTSATVAGPDPFLIERTHPLLKDVQLQGVRWSGVQPLKWNVTPLISARRQVLLGRLKETETEAYVLNVDLAKSSLAQTPDWLIFLQNLIERRRDALPGLRRWNYRAGEDVQFRLPAPDDANGGEGPLKLVRLVDAASRESSADATPAEDRKPADGDELIRNVARTRFVQFSPPMRPGVYELRDGERSLGQFSVGFLDARGSDLSGLKPGRRLPEEGSAGGGFFVDEPFSALLFGLLLLALAALVGDWWVLRPKRL